MVNKIDHKRNGWSTNPLHRSTFHETCSISNTFSHTLSSPNVWAAQQHIQSCVQHVTLLPMSVNLRTSSPLLWAGTSGQFNTSIIFQVWGWMGFLTRWTRAIFIVIPQAGSDVVVAVVGYQSIGTMSCTLTLSLGILSKYWDSIGRKHTFVKETSTNTKRIS